MTSAEFQEWRAYYQEEPFGDLRADFRNGVLASIVRNLFLDRGETPAAPVDFITHADGQVAASGPAASTEPDALERRQSQTSTIAAMKSAFEKG